MVYTIHIPYIYQKSGFQMHFRILIGLRRLKTTEVRETPKGRKFVPLGFAGVSQGYLFYLFFKVRQLLRILLRIYLDYLGFTEALIS